MLSFLIILARLLMSVNCSATIRLNTTNAKTSSTPPPHARLSHSKTHIVYISPPYRFEFSISARPKFSYNNLTTHYD